MKAFVLEKYGTPMREVSMPEPTTGPRQLLVRMVAAGVNHADERTRAGELKAVFRLDLPQVMGGELSGEVVAVGDQVTEFAVGDEVYGYTGVVGMGIGGSGLGARCCTRRSTSGRYSRDTCSFMAQRNPMSMALCWVSSALRRAARTCSPSSL